MPNIRRPGRGSGASRGRRKGTCRRARVVFRRGRSGGEPRGIQMALEGAGEDWGRAHPSRASCPGPTAPNRVTADQGLISHLSRSLRSQRGCCHPNVWLHLERARHRVMQRYCKRLFRAHPPQLTPWVAGSSVAPEGRSPLPGGGSWSRGADLCLGTSTCSGFWPGLL